MEDRILEEFDKLVETVARLRAPGGCPWDREQTHSTLKRHVIEEAYEVVEAIDSGDPAKLKEELGDLMLQVLMHAQIASEAGEFDVGDVCKVHREKLVRRHPHVFGEVKVSGVDDVLYNWEQIKKAEPGKEERKSAIDGVPNSMPALMRAAKIGKKAARTGFDWPNAHAVIDKIKEETQELEEVIDTDKKDEIKHEIGDLLFTIVNISRLVKVDPEDALREMLKRFSYRFKQIEKKAESEGRNISDMTLEEMDKVWDEAKQDQC